MKKTWLLAAALFAPLANGAYKCVDERGRTHIGDTPPPGCATVVMYETNAMGQVVRKIDPTPTPEQLKARQEEFERSKEQRRQEADQKRKDDALMATFSSEREFDVVRDRNIGPIKNRISLAQERIKAVDKRQQSLDEEMEFYRAGKSKAKSAEPPQQLISDIARMKSERVSLEKSIASSEKEMEDLKQKFDTDKKRWMALKGIPPKPELADSKDSKSGSKSDAKPDSKSDPKSDSKSDSKSDPKAKPDDDKPDDGKPIKKKK